MRPAIAIIIIFVVILTGCNLADVIAARPSESLPVPAPTLGRDDPLLQEAREYAEEANIPLEEAVHWLMLQNDLSDLEAALFENEAETFGGLWTQDEPTHRVVIAFTENGEEILRPYIERKPYAALIEVRTIEYTWEELNAIQAEVHETLAEEGIASSPGVDVQQNRVELPSDNPERLAADLAKAGIELPEAVAIIEATLPLDCQMWEDFVIDYAEGQGYETPQEALEHLEPFHFPPGELTRTVEEENTVTWLYYENGNKVGEIHAVRTSGGVWVIEGGMRCVGAAQTTPDVTTVVGVFGISPRKGTVQELSRSSNDRKAATLAGSE